MSALPRHPTAVGLACVCLLAGRLAAQAPESKPLQLERFVVTPSHFDFSAGGTGGATLTQQDLETLPQIGEDLFRSIARLPGVVETGIIRGQIENAPDPAAARAAYEGMSPLGRMGGVDEIAGLVAWLASDEARFVSGSEYVIDGATTAGMMGV